MTGGKITRRQALKELLALATGAAALAACSVTAAPDAGSESVTVTFGEAENLPDPSQIERLVMESFNTVSIYDRTGKHLLMVVSDPRGDRTYVRLEQIPLYLRQATIALEDKSFYENSGIDLSGFARAYLSNLRGESIQGGSTITMQLVKNILLPPEERYQMTYERKMKEASLAMELTRLYPGKEGKDRILEWYLNSNFYGNHAYGVEAAAQLYFGKHVWELTLAEAATLVAIPQSPALNPIDNAEAAKRRQGIVLDAMVRQGYLSEEEAGATKAGQLVIRSSAERYQMRAPHFALYVRDLLQHQFGDSMHALGLRAYTTLDMGIQEMAERVAAEKIAEYGVANDCGNAAVVVIRPATGEILAMVGSVDYNNEEIAGQVNMALAPRQPGSSFKPYVYLAAFEQGYTAATMVLDIPTAFDNPPFDPYTPMNIDMKFHGAVRLRQALACSYNVAAVKLLQMLGIPKAVEMARRLGITTITNESYGLSLALGAEEIRLLDHVFAYGTLANGGIMAGRVLPEHERLPGFAELGPVAILLVEDGKGNILQQYTQPELRQVVQPQHVYILTNILSDEEARKPAFGASAANLVLADRPVATKTGSTNERTDGWTMGYTPQYAVGVWIGNADRHSMKQILGSTGAGPIYHAIMEQLHQGQPVVAFPRPEKIVEAEVCDLSGQLPNDYCPRRVKEVFVEGSEPKDRCTMHQLVRINRQTGQLATADTPADQIEERVFTVYPAEAAAWAQENSTPQPPTGVGEVPEGVLGAIRISYPGAGAVLSGIVSITGTALSGNLWYHKVEFSQDGVNWTTCEADYMKTAQVDGGILATWDTTTVANGSYLLRAMVVDNTGNYVSTDPIAVTVAN